MDLAYLPAWKLAEMTRTGEIGCAELIDAAIARVERLDSRINAVVVRDFERARKRARQLDHGGRAKAGPLFGVPMTVKESFDLKGHPTTWGFEWRRDHRAEADALPIERLEAAGAVVLGKTNVPVGLADWQSYNPIYDTTHNPWNDKHTPGGSSGGSAASIAAGFAALELGSDIGGSVRVPAHFCGVFGHKPTWNLLPARGHALQAVASVTDISVIGPLARSARDLSTALDLLAIPDPLDTMMTYNLPAPRPRSLRDLRVALWAEEPGQATSADVTVALHRLADALEREGAKVSRTARPELDPIEAFHLYLTLLDAAWSGRMPPEEIERRLAAKARLPADAMNADAIMLRAAGMTHREWLGHNERRHQYRRAWSAFFRDWDVLLCPALGTPALPHRQDGPTWERTLEVDGRTIAYNDLLFWPGITCGFHLPASVAPVGLSPHGLPIGVQIVGPIYGDRTTIAVAAMIEQAGHHFVAPPGWG
ncbi:MAG TPA: amidase [Acetobacteraceae bacterium]|nr:amidase [Acetobacteraceae bacterium]